MEADYGRVKIIKIKTICIIVGRGLRNAIERLLHCVVALSANFFVVIHNL
jgi:hypothetical protein